MHNKYKYNIINTVLHYFIHGIMLINIFPDKGLCGCNTSVYLVPSHREYTDGTVYSLTSFIGLL